MAAARIPPLERFTSDIGSPTGLGALALEHAGEVPPEKRSQRVVNRARSENIPRVADHLDAIGSALAVQNWLEAGCNLRSDAHDHGVLGPQRATYGAMHLQCASDVL
jgi:hypothetical protein